MLIQIFSRHLSVLRRVKISNILPGLRMSFSSQSLEDKYQEAIQTLDTLQSNSDVIKKVNEERDRFRNMNLLHVSEFLTRIKLTPEMVNKLSVIHVTGTKGKGSTCAFTESILRHQGYKTGFYSSPHLVEVRERIRINGQPLSKEQFIHYFWNTYNPILESRNNYQGNMPAYFRFLTVMAINVYLQENIDVAIFEVGIGGRFDCTNIFRSPVVCCITSLGLDHTAILGNTVEDIAWQKAGIIKSGSITFTMTDQPGKSLSVIAEEAHKKKSPLYLIPSSSSTSNSSSDINSNTISGCGDQSMFNLKLGISGHVQQLNASLAVQLARSWMKNRDKDEERRLLENEEYFSHFTKDNIPLPILSINNLSDIEIKGLEATEWPGRFDIVHQDRVTYYLDGAHTDDSVQICAEWFQSAVLDKESYRVLIFNATGQRNVAPMLEILYSLGFDKVIFTPNQTFLEDNKADNFRVTDSPRHLRQQCEINQRVWNNLIRPVKLGSLTSSSRQIGGGDVNSLFTRPTQSLIVSCVSEAVDCVKSQLTNQKSISVLITGSLHLIGSAMRLVRPNLYKE